MRASWMTRIAPALLCAMLVSILGPGWVVAEDAPPKLSSSDLETLVGPIALYPDPILAQVLTASTFPDQVVDANKWAAAHKGLEDEALATAMSEANLAWDASVQALVPFPSVLEELTRDRNNLNKLGDAVLSQRADVMTAVQAMRKKAKDLGNLKSSEQLTVSTEEDYIVIQPTNPQVIYVPVYSPAVVYAPPPPTGAVLFGFVAGVAVASMMQDNWYGGCGFYWHSSTVVIHNSAWGRTYYNRYSYHPPYPRPVYVNHNTNININTGNTNINTGNINTGNRNNINTGNVNTGNIDKNKINSDRAAVSGKGATASTGAVNRPSTGTANRPTTGAAGSGTSARPSTGAAPSASQQRPTTSPGSNSRGYTQAPKTSSTSALSGSQNGRSESVASSRGRASSGGGGSHSAAASRGGGGGGGRRR